MASWWPPQHLQQQSTESFDYPHPSQDMSAAACFYDSHAIMIEGGNNVDYIMHPNSNGNLNEFATVDYHHRRSSCLNG